jgi:hypothetical protein
VLKRGRTSPAESSLLDRKSSEASTPPMSSGKPPRSSPAAAAAGQKASPKSSDAVTSSGAAQKARPRGTAAAAEAGGGAQGHSSDATGQGKPLAQALAAELQRLLKAQEVAQRLDAEATALLQSDDAAVELLASLGGEQQGELDDIIMTNVPLLDVLGGSVRGTAAAAAGSGAAAAVDAAAAGGQAAAAAGSGGWRTGRLKPQRVRPARASDSFDSAEDLEDLPDWAGPSRQQTLRSPDPVTSGGGTLNRVDAKLQSIRRAAFKIGREPSMSAEMAAPRPGKAGRPSLPPRPKPRPSSSGGSGGSRKKEKLPATNTFSAASDVKAMSKLDSLLRAKDAAAAIKAAVQSGLPYEGTLEQRHHAMRQQLRNQLPDGRVPCAEGLAVLQSTLSGQLPGARLDSEWLVYPSTPVAAEGAVKLDILIRHPRVTQGHFRCVLKYLRSARQLSSL